MKDRGVVSTLLTGALVVLVGVGAFGLGRLSALREQKARLVIYAPQMPAALASPVPLSDNNSETPKPAVDGPHTFVASKNGTKYYPAGCAGASRIKAANQVWFAAADLAAAAGYTPAAGCSGVQ